MTRLRPRLAPALALFLLFQGIYALTAAGWVFRVPDEFEVYFQTESLVDHGTLAVPQTLALEVGRSRFFGKMGGPERKTPYAPYGPLVAFLAVPHHLAGRAVAALVGVDRAASPLAWQIVVSGLTALAAGTAGALAVAGFFRAARALGASERRACALALVLGLATVLWPESRSFFSEPFAAAALVWAVALLLEARAPGAPHAVAKLALASGLLAVAVLVKATNVIYALPIALAPLAERALEPRARARAVFALGLGLAAAALVHLQWNVHRFGSALDLGYDWTETIRGTPKPFAASLARGLAVLLLSPGKSLVLWAPALALLAAPRARALARDRALSVAVLGALAAGLLVFGKYMFPEGGYCHGPRHLVPVVPLALLPAALGPAPRRGALVAALAVGLFVNFPAATTSYLEDQVWGEDRSRLVYYERDRDAAEGLPENRYRLAYLPEVSLPRILLRSAAALAHGEPETPGTGIDVFPLHLARARAALAPADAAALPRALGPLLALAALVLAAAGAASAGRTLLTAENAAILPRAGEA